MLNEVAVSVDNAVVQFAEIDTLGTRLSGRVQSNYGMYDVSND